MDKQETRGHLAALLTIIIWGITYISTKLLLEAFTPIEILLLRFVMGYLSLYLVYPQLLPLQTVKRELYFAAAGLCGICLYYLLENIALTLTYASNVGIISAVAPFFTAIVGALVYGEKEEINRYFIIGFVIAMFGIYLITFQNAELVINPVGDFLALLAIVVWAFYSNIIKKISVFGYHTILVTRRVFAYGLLFMFPVAKLLGCNPAFNLLLKPLYMGNLVFLGFGASALCFVTWNYSVKQLGVIKTSVYIYLIPVITIASAVIVLDEKITQMTMLGTVLTLVGLVLSHHRAG